MANLVLVAPPQRSEAKALFRAMAASGSGLPELGETDLGVRVPTDIRIDASGDVHPDRGGMSVAPDDPRNLHPHHRPRSLGGTGTKPVWIVLEQQLNGGLRYLATSLTHGTVGPAIRMPIASFLSALQVTQPDWALHCA